jgi:hypothetical protein
MGATGWVPVPSGPLAPFAAGYRSWLVARGYSSWTVGDRLGQLELVSRWMAREGLSVDQLTSERLVEFARGRRAEGYRSWSSPLSVRVPVGYLPNRPAGDRDRCRHDPWQRQRLDPASLAANDQLSAPPVQILEPDRGDLARPQPQPDHQQQDRVITPADRPPPVTASQKPLDRRRVQPAWQRAVAQVCDARHRPLQRHRDQPRDVQVAQQRAQHRHQIPRASDAASRALTRQKRAHIRRHQPRQVKPARSQPL